MEMKRNAAKWWGMLGLVWLAMIGSVSAAEGNFLDQRLDPIADVLDAVIFYSITFQFAGSELSVPLVLLVLAGTALFLTLYFRFVNLTSFGLAYRTVKGKYSNGNDPGQITHFQALSAALSATVGLGNIAGVAVAIGVGGPGAMVWMVVMGLLGMTTKFCECTLGVKYRQFDKDKKTYGGAMYYLSKGLAEKGMGGVGKVLAIFFAVMCVGAALGAGNMFQANQAYSQCANAFGVFQGDQAHWFGIGMAVLVALVILGGIKSIARVTSLLVPFMCLTYVVASLMIIFTNYTEIIPSLKLIFVSAFAPTAVAGGFIGGMIQGIRRAAFSNEAGVGSAPIAHSAVKTNKPASEGLVALLEPFVDTVVVCSMTALVLVITGTWKIDAIAENGDVQLYGSPNAIVRTVDGTEKLNLVEKSSDGSYAKAKFVEKDDKGKEKASFGWVPVANLSIEEGKTQGSDWSATATLKEATQQPVFATASADVKPADVVTKGESLRTIETSGDKQFAKVYRGESEPEQWVKLGDVRVVEGIEKTSMAFKTEFDWFPKVLSVAVFLFAFSTMISWSYYGEQAVSYLFGENNKWVIVVYKVLFCGFVVVGVSASLDNVLRVSDSMFFAMVIPNMVALYVLLPVVKKELQSYRAHVAEIDGKSE